MTQPQPSLSAEPDAYKAFLVRIWLEKTQNAGWQASVENVHSGKTVALDDVTQLITFLSHELNQQPT